MNRNVLLGMSGGVDSSVAAILLKEQGFHITGVTFLFGNNSDANKIMVIDAKELANKLNISHFVVDLRDKFNKEIITYFKDEYVKGNTPFPCAKCNPLVKFNALLKSAESQKCEFIATGHYARVGSFNSKRYIFSGIDSDKDQSFFLWGLNDDVRKRLILPLGDKTKTEVRELAKLAGHEKLASKSDSLGVCFIQGKNYREFLQSERIMSAKGDFVDEFGNILGQHRGIINYTIGQRRGLGINLNCPLFVSEIRPDKNEVVLSKFSGLYKHTIHLKDIYFIDKEEINSEVVYNLKIRYRLQNTPCKILIVHNNSAKIILLEPLAMVSNGQTAVFYDGDRVIGGGFIESSE